MFTFRAPISISNGEDSKVFAAKAVNAPRPGFLMDHVKPSVQQSETSTLGRYVWLLLKVPDLRRWNRESESSKESLFDDSRRGAGVLMVIIQPATPNCKACARAEVR